MGKILSLSKPKVNVLQYLIYFSAKRLYNVGMAQGKEKA